MAWVSGDRCLGPAPSRATSLTGPSHLTCRFEGVDQRTKREKTNSVDKSARSIGALTLPTPSRNARACGAFIAPVGHDHECGARIEPSATQRACIEVVRRISELHAELAAATATLAQNLEAAVAAGTERSVHADVPPVPETPLK